VGVAGGWLYVFARHRATVDETDLRADRSRSHSERKSYT
jgi:hypothetical protein